LIPPNFLVFFFCQLSHTLSYRYYWLLTSLLAKTATASAPQLRIGGVNVNASCLRATEQCLTKSQATYSTTTS